LKRRTDHYASFKDPAASVFYLEEEAGFIFRQLSPAYLSHYHHFRSSGLAEELIKKNWLIPFEETDNPGDAVVLKAKKIDFVTYPYEWTFSQWKDAALLTLKIHYQALKFGMILKDATPFNIVFDGPRPVFVDISSFEVFKEGQPWPAFKQFSENFYLPLLLVKYFDATGNDMYRSNINGIPISKGLSLLPAKAYFNFNTLFFLALPARIREQREDKRATTTTGAITVKSSMQLANQLFSVINKIKQAKQQTKWNDYYDRNIDAAYLAEKEKLIVTWAGNNYINKTVIDFGCNTGNFSRLLARVAGAVIAFDEDMRSADELYAHCKENKITNISCFAVNLSQPTPALGWNNLERQCLKDRLHGQLGLALALIHHLAISNHIRFNMMADFFAATCQELFIEFVPAADEKVQLLLNGREDSFDWYTLDNFKHAFQQKYTLVKEHCFSNNRVLLHFTLLQHEP
jgi:SAM-dependent methyltransferase